MSPKTFSINSLRIIWDKKILIGISGIIILLAGGWWIWKDQPCDQKCKLLGYRTGYCGSLPGPGYDCCRENELGIGRTIDCDGSMEKWACCCKK